MTSMELRNFKNARLKDMSKTRINSKENILDRILSSLDSTWAKLTIVGAIIIVGFKAGCYYQETIMTHYEFGQKNPKTSSFGKIDIVSLRIGYLKYTLYQYFYAISLDF